MSAAWSAGAGRGVQVMRSGSSQLSAAQAAVENAKGDAGSFESTSGVLLERLESIISHLPAEGPAMLESSSGVAEIRSLLIDTKQHVLSACQLSSTLQAALDKLMAILQQVVQENSSLKAENSSLKARVQQLESELSQIKAGVQQQKEAVLLGQLVYVVDAAARGIVLQGNSSSSSSSRVGAPGKRRMPFYTLPDLLQKKRDGELTAEQHANLQTLEQVMQQRTRQTVGEIAISMRTLREGRASAAHSTEQERNTVSAQQLRGWAQRAGVPSDDFETVLEVAQLFSKPEHPLVLAADPLQRLAQVRRDFLIHKQSTRL